ncbi:uncharacterized protein TEOVI_000319500 [Trypanosoma equiperdum]|uniref:Uncharacterized protein n=2 Tax=Trypanozoon TaxID=39700 RepID=Q38B46_TRYB2|nr:hypothetical protein, conserved [Trypanosoma brucei brucei TREU927]EAN77974.1 hypothetical protein, conserved [Trypanosoma brucei brucei TREU927]SCU71614.1 hypothetical protein, conserved [Trypanosoma equiperdum]
MVLYVMGPPRGRGGANTSRPIIAVLADVSFDTFRVRVLCIESIVNRPMAFTALKNTYCDAYNPTSSGPFLSAGNSDSLMDLTVDDKKQELGALKGFQASPPSALGSVLIDIPLDTSHMSPDDFMSIAFSPRCNPLGSFHRLSVSAPLVKAAYIHDYVIHGPDSPGRNDFIRAMERRGSATRRDTSTRSVSPLTLPPTFPLPSGVYEPLMWEEVEARARLVHLEDVTRRQCHSAEVSGYLRAQRLTRCKTSFHFSDFSAKKRIHEAEVKLLREDMEVRAKRERAEHEEFMRAMTRGRTQLLKLPTITTSGKKYKPTEVDKHVARVLTFRKRAANKSDSKERHFLEIL